MSARVNLFTQDVRRNPYPVYAKLRSEDPVCQVDPGGVWVATRYDHVLRVLMSPSQFSSAGFEALLKPAWLGSNPIGDSMLAKDPPVHTKLRALVKRAFTPQGVASLAPFMEQITADCAERLSALGEADLVAEFSLPLPTQIIGRILGLERSLHVHFKRWGDHIVTVSPAPPEDAVADAIRTSIKEMGAYLREVIEARRRSPMDDMITALLSAEIDGQTLTEDEVVAFLSLLLPAGFETTVNLISNAVMALADRPELTARLRQSPELVPAFLEEVMRWDAPVHGVARLTTAEVELGGVVLPPGSFVVALIASANRDETRFPDPDRLDIDRNTHGSVAFGHGPHHCLGFSLARLEARIALEALLRRFRAVERIPGDLEYNVGFTVRGPVAVPMRFHAA